MNSDTTDFVLSWRIAEARKKEGKKRLQSNTLRVYMYVVFETICGVQVYFATSSHKLNLTM